MRILRMTEKVGRRATALAAAVGVAAALTIVAAPTASAAGGIGPRSLGVTAVTLTTNPTSASMARDFAQIKASGVPSVRLPIQWPDIERTQGNFDWTIPDQLVYGAYYSGLKILGVATYTPSWAAIPAGRSYIHPAPNDPAQYANFVKLAAQRYKGIVDNWEIWNEPNIQGSFAPRPDVARYTQMLKLSYQAVKSVNPVATVISAGSAPTLDSGVEISPGTFMQGIYANGGKGFFDAVGLHPYSTPDNLSTASYPWSSKTHIQNVQASMNQNGDGGKLFWTTEYGAPTAPGQQYGVTEAQQASILADGIRYLRSLPNCGPIFIFDFRDTNTGSTNVEQNFGLLRTNYSPKPAMATVRSMINQ
jgi:hypothetical protein